jgi:hypothetical protein
MTRPSTLSLPTEDRRKKRTSEKEKKEKWRKRRTEYNRPKEKNQYDVAKKILKMFNKQKITWQNKAKTKTKYRNREEKKSNKIIFFSLPHSQWVVAAAAAAIPHSFYHQVLIFQPLRHNSSACISSLEKMENGNVKNMKNGNMEIQNYSRVRKR